MLLAMKDAGLKPDEARCGHPHRWPSLEFCFRSCPGAWGFAGMHSLLALEVVFNNLLGGCINDCKLELAKESVKRLDAVM